MVTKLKYCNNCGQPINHGILCSKCRVEEREKIEISNKYGIASLVFSVLAMISWGFVLEAFKLELEAILLWSSIGMLAWAFASTFKAIKSIKAFVYSFRVDKGHPIVGMVLGIIGSNISLLFIVMWLFGIVPYALGY